MASAMRAARARLEFATHDLANVSSDGYRRASVRVALGARGLEVRSAATHEQGGITPTGRAFDVALLGEGAFTIDGGTTRSGAFSRDRDGRLVDDRGRRLHGAHGALRAVSAEATIEPDGTVRDRGRVVDRLTLPAGTTIRAGALERSNVDPIGETLAIVDAQRAFETAQKVFVAIDSVRQKTADDVGRLK